MNEKQRENLEKIEKKWKRIPLYEKQKLELAEMNTIDINLAAMEAVSEYLSYLDEQIDFKANEIEISAEEIFEDLAKEITNALWVIKKGIDNGVYTL